MNGECCGSREEGQANDIPATLVVEFYTSFTVCSGDIKRKKSKKLKITSQKNLTPPPPVKQLSRGMRFPIIWYERKAKA